MIRILVASLVAAFAVFSWGAFAWMGGLWSWGLRPMPRDAGVEIMLAAKVHEPGAYLFPPMPEESAETPEAESVALLEAWEERHAAGPVGVLLIRPEGAPVFDPKVLARGFAVEWTAALALAILAALVRGGFGRRLLATCTAVFFALFAIRGVDWTFFLLPDPYAWALVLDSLIGWSIAATLCAAIVAGPPKAAYGTA